MITITDWGGKWWGERGRAAEGRINPLQDDERHADIFYTEHYIAK